MAVDYKLICADHLGDVKRGGVCVYFEESPPVRIIHLFYIEEAFLLELCYLNKKVPLIYPSLCQSNDKFDFFKKSFRNYYFTLIN